MFNLLKSRIDAIKQDSYILYILLIALAVASAQLYLFFNDSLASHPLPRAVFWFSVIPIVFFFGRLGCNIGLLVYSNVMVYFIRYDNYTFAVFALFFFFTFRHTKVLKWVALGSYILQVIIIIQLHHLSSFHLVIHLGIGLILFLKFAELSSMKKQELLLKLDEIKILDYMRNGVRQNDIADYSAQTVSRKLKAARERNKLKDNDELLRLFAEQQKEA